MVKVHSPTLYLVYIAIGIMIIELLTVSIEPKVGLFSNIKDRRPVKIVATDHAGFLKMSKLYNIIIGIINTIFDYPF